VILEGAVSRSGKNFNAKKVKENPLKITTILLIASMGATFASDLPLVEYIDPGHPSKDEVGTINANGHKSPIHLRTFGSDRIAAAKEFGKSVAHDSDPARRVREKAFELYPDNPFFQKCFRQYAFAP
jgi:hypothetical protein